MTIAQMRYPCTCKREFLQIKSCDRNKKNLLIELGEHYCKLLTSCSLISQCSIGLVFGSSAANVRILKGAPDGGVRIPNPARKLRQIPHPAELFGPIPHPAGCLLFVLFLLRNNISEIPYSIVIRMSQIYGRLP